MQPWDLCRLRYTYLVLRSVGLSGQPGTLWLSFPCNGKALHSSLQPVASAASCLDYGLNTMDLVLSGAVATAWDDQCGPLSVHHGLDAGPLYLFLGAACSLPECTGDHVTAPTHSRKSSSLAMGDMCSAVSMCMLGPDLA